MLCAGEEAFEGNVALLLRAGQPGLLFLSVPMAVPSGWFFPDVVVRATSSEAGALGGHAHASSAGGWASGWASCRM